jgi:hypothetical protein
LRFPCDTIVWSFEEVLLDFVENFSEVQMFGAGGRGKWQKNWVSE